MSSKIPGCICGTDRYGWGAQEISCAEPKWSLPNVSSSFVTASQQWTRRYTQQPCSLCLSQIQLLSQHDANVPLIAILGYIILFICRVVYWNTYVPWLQCKSLWSTGFNSVEHPCDVTNTCHKWIIAVSAVPTIGARGAVPSSELGYPLVKCPPFFVPLLWC